MDYSFLKHRLRDAAVHKRTELGADFARYAFTRKSRDFRLLADENRTGSAPFDDRVL